GLGSCPPHAPVSVHRVSVPACADPATLCVCISRNNSQTHLHPEQWFQFWKLLHLLVPAESREPSPVSPVLLLRLNYRAGTWDPQPLLWLQRHLGQSRASAHLWAAL
ncbi:unnamed protein product, partial [Gulo gulo]